MVCRWHLCGKTLTGRQFAFCSTKCKNKYHVKKARRRLKERAVALLGGACSRCGYNRSIAALDFHHPDSNKEFGVSSGTIRSWERVRVEVLKCILLCANCHREEHHSPVA